MTITTMRGQKIDIARLAAQNPEKMALSGSPKGRNGKKAVPGMNARGDILGKGGKVVIPREQVARDYHKANPKAVKQIAMRDIRQELFAAPTPAQAIANHKEAMAAAKTQRKQRKIVDND